MTSPVTSMQGFTQPVGFSRPYASAGTPPEPKPESSRRSTLSNIAMATGAMAYAANHGSLATKAADSVEKHWIQRAVSDGGDHLFRRFADVNSVNLLDKFRLSEDTQKALKAWGKAEVRNIEPFSTASLLHIGNKTIKNIHTNDTFWQKYIKAVKDNFSPPKVDKAGQIEYAAKGLTSASPPLTVKNYLRYGVMGQHTRNIAKFLSGEGGPLRAGVSVLNLFTFAACTAKAMKQAFQRSKEQQEGGLTTLFKTLKAGTKELLKLVASWHIGSLFYPIAAALVPIPGLNVAAGLALAITAGVVSSRGITKLIGPSVEENHLPTQA